ncbi:hypothetical protein FQA39_LY14957 [Lamprigera yunnana]|nr:hypothetical protein FQA39_LY14957 [Lamprigera yunnana]
MDQRMEKIQRQFLTIQSINEKWEKKYVEVDNEMEKIQEQVDNNSGEINGICKRLREQGTKLINVEAKINQHKEEKIQVCEGHNVITNYRKIEREAPKFHPSKNQHPKMYVQELQTYLEVIKKQIGNQYGQAMEDAIIKEAMRGETETWYRTKVGKYRNFKQFRKGFMKNYWGMKEESVMKSELYGTKFSHSLRLDEITIVHILAVQFEKKIHNKVIIDETKNFDDLVKILKAHHQCERGRKRLDGATIMIVVIIIITSTGNTTATDKKAVIIIILGVLFTGINSNTITIIEIKDFRIIGDGITTEMDNTKIHTDLENRRGREKMMEPLKDMKMKMRTIDQVEEIMSVEKIIGMNILNQYKMVIDFDKKCVKWSNYEKYFVEGNKEEEEPEKHMDKEININNVNNRRNAENDNPIGENGIKKEMSDKDKYCIRNNRYKENYEEKKSVKDF